MRPHESIFGVIGLSDNEATVYLALLRKATHATAHQLATLIGMKPSTVHDNLRFLMRKGFVTRKQVTRHKQLISQYYITDRGAVLKTIQSEARRQLADQRRKGNREKRP